VDEQLAGQEAPTDPKQLGVKAKAFCDMSVNLGDKVLGALASQSDVDKQGLGLGNKRDEVHEAMVEIEEACKHAQAAAETGDAVEATKALQDMREKHETIKQVAQALGLAGDDTGEAPPDDGSGGGAPPGEDDEGLGAWGAAMKKSPASAPVPV
jgi:hypothetical protein